MKIVKDIATWREIRQGLEGTIGFVPTMGNLHPGHLSLFDKSVRENALTVVSLFVNPTQFNNENDFENYPKTETQDLQLLTDAKVDYCFMPEKAAMYPDEYRFQVVEKKDSLTLEGAHRPGHFDGVLTVVLKLLMLIRADSAYFGEKDYQQYLLIKNMADAFFVETEIVVCPIVREASGLAYSSRNTRLNKKQKEKAIQFAKYFHAGKDVASIKMALEKENITIDYIEDSNKRRYGAVWIDSIRLIDNYKI
jgi:pantoate--beta-alanine ligase